ncbi:hypothetical protein [Vibrio vulnificus]|uniref:hypothetical protein n=1 Tax=Vibrio vulnificus TaxID=672 RepID=UPI0032428970
MASSDWDGKISNLKVSEQAFPELYKELSQMHHKDRCDRLRCLAMLGMYALRGGVMTTVQHSSPPIEELVEEKDKNLDKARIGLKSKLLKSV